MRILIHDYPGHPFQVQLSRSLARRNHQVLHLYSASDITPRGVLQRLPGDPPAFTCQGLFLSKPFQKFSFFRRRSQEIEYGRLAVKELHNFAPDVFVSSNTPLDPQKMLLRECRKNNIKFVYWVQDLIGTGITKILSKKLSFLGFLIGWYYQNLEYSMLRNSDQIIIISNDFAPILEKNNVQAEKIHVVHNWAPLDELPMLPKDNDWARKYYLHDKLNIIYTGTLGRKHNPGLILSLAIRLRNRQDVNIIVISEGLGASFLADKKQEAQLENLRLFGFQPFELMPQILATADILMAILEEDAGVFSVPSKVLSYHCAGRPLLLSVPLDNLAARLVRDNQTGMVVAPRDEEGFMEAAATLISDQDLRTRYGQKARAYAEAMFDIEKITDIFEQIVLS